jgi:hypothetical protein
MGYSEPTELTDGVGQHLTADWMNEFVRDNQKAIWKGTAAGSMEYYDSATTKVEIPVGSAGMTLNTDGSVPSWGNVGLLGCLLSDTNFQSIGYSGMSAVTFAAEEYDSNGFANLAVSTSRMTIPSGFGGLYQVSFTACVSYSGSYAGGSRYSLIKNSSSTIGGGSLNWDVALGVGNIHFSCLVELVATDYIIIGAQSEGYGVTITVGGGAGAPTYFSVLRIGQ